MLPVGDPGKSNHTGVSREALKKNHTIHFEIHTYKMKIADAIFIVKMPDEYYFPTINAL